MQAMAAWCGTVTCGFIRGSPCRKEKGMAGDPAMPSRRHQKLAPTRTPKVRGAPVKKLPGTRLSIVTLFSTFFT